MPDPSVAQHGTVHPLRRGRLRFAALIALLVVMATLVSTGIMPDVATMAAAFPEPGPVAAVSIVAGASILLAALVPRSVVAAGAGLLFGAMPGAAYVMAGALLGAVVTFELGRLLGREFLRHRRRTASIDRFLQRRGMTGVLVLRLLPVAPFGLVGYAFGATAVRRPVYLRATALGIAPTTVLFATLGAHVMAPTSPAFILSLVAAVVLAVIGIFGARLATRGSAPRSSQ